MIGRNAAGRAVVIHEVGADGHVHPAVAPDGRGPARDGPVPDDEPRLGRLCRPGLAGGRPSTHPDWVLLRRRMGRLPDRRASADPLPPPRHGRDAPSARRGAPMIEHAVAHACLDRADRRRLIALAAPHRPPRTRQTRACRRRAVRPGSAADLPLAIRRRAARRRSGRRSAPPRTTATRPAPRRRRPSSTTPAART